MNLLNADSFKKLPKGYLLAQQVSTYVKSQFGAISTEKEAEKLFLSIPEKVNGVEYSTLWYTPENIQIHKTIGSLAKKYNIELWGSSYNLLNKINSFKDIKLKPEFIARYMNKKGQIIKGNIDKNTPLLDVLNPQAVEWFLNQYRKNYLLRMKPLLNGFFINEDILTHKTKRPANNKRYDYWNNPTYSDSVLKQWKVYCIENDVTFNKKIVDKFPVHKASMVKTGSIKIEYYPGYNIPHKIKPGQKFTNLPKAYGVWKHWYNFIGGLFIKNWLGKLGKAANDVNKDNLDWYGVAYFGHASWSLPYEYIKEDSFTVPSMHKWGAWGRQRGLDLIKLVSHPDINIIICETYPPIKKGNLEYFIKEYKRITEKANKHFGIMVHRDDSWSLNLGEERERWRLIQKLNPDLIARYPLKRMLKNNKYYNLEVEAFFSRKLSEYRK